MPIDYYRIWRKEYRKALLLLGFIYTIIPLISFYYLSTPLITFSNWLLGVTGLIVFWYTRETYDLKVIQQKQLNVLRDKEKKSELQIEFTNSIPYCRKTNGVILPSGEKVIRNSYHVRLRIKNVSDRIAKGCEVKLLEIKHKNKMSSRQDFDPVVLHWVGTPQNPIDINSNEYEFVDLISTSEENNLLAVEAADKAPRGMNFFPERDDYFFRIGVYGENVIPLEKELHFKNDNVYDKVTVTEVTK